MPLLLLGPCSASRAVMGPDTSATLPTGDWQFQASLDGKPIGEHRFTVSGQGNERSVRSVASFDVKFLGLTAYRYRHSADERWRDGCLVSLDARTDDDGKLATVVARPSSQAAESASAAVQVTGTGFAAGAGPLLLPGCVMSFAYWNPAMQKQARLLNPQTGRYEQVGFAEGKAGTLAVRGQTVAARQLRLTGPKDPIDLWYSPQGEWLGLDSQVNGRLLTYRLKPRQETAP